MHRRGTAPGPAATRSPGPRPIAGKPATTIPADSDARRRLSDFAEAAADWFWETDHTMALTHFSSSANSLVPNVAQSLHHGNLPFGSHEHQADSRLLAATAARQPFRDLTLTGKTTDGARWHVRISGKPLFAPDNQFLGYRGVGCDIAESDATADARRSLDRRFANMFGASIGCLAIVGRDGIVADLNPAGVKLFQAASSEGVVGRPIREFVTPEHQVIVEAALAQAFAGKATTIQCQGADLSGRRLWLELTAAPISEEPEDADAVLTIIRDITLDRMAEERMREAEKLEAIGRLTGGVAHDFNNILTVIIGNSEMLADRAADDAESRKLAEISLSAARAGADLTRMLLAYSRRQALQPTEFCAADMLREVRSLLERSLGDNVGIEVEADEDPWGVVADRAQLASVMLNLALNARDAMPRGGKITVEARNATLDAAYALRNADVIPGQYVMIAVSDTGMGIPSHIIDRVFEPFFTTKEIGKGSGLGLSMVYGFARQSGGHVKIYSERGIGTVVRLYLPRAQVQLQLPNIETDPGSFAARPGETVLVVEDSGAVRELIVTQLQSLGYTVIAATDGKAALAALRDMRRLDLLISDVVMPGIDGVKLVERARRLRPGLRVVLTSGYTDQGLESTGRFALLGKLLSKPFTQLELARKVRAAIDGRL